MPAASPAQPVTRLGSVDRPVDCIPRWIFENARPRACSISWFATWLAACCSRPMPTYRNPVEALIASVMSDPKITVTAMTVSIRLKPRSSSWIRAWIRTNRPVFRFMDTMAPPL